MADQKKPTYDPTEDMSTSEKFFAGMGQAVARAGRWAGNKVGLVSDDEIKEANRLDAALMKTTAAQVGQMTGDTMMTVPATMAASAVGLTGLVARGAALVGKAVPAPVVAAAAVVARPVAAVVAKGKAALSATGLMGTVAGKGVVETAKKAAVVADRATGQVVSNTAKAAAQTAVKADLATGQVASRITKKALGAVNVVGKGTATTGKVLAQAAIAAPVAGGIIVTGQNAYETVVGAQSADEKLYGVDHGLVFGAALATTVGYGLLKTGQSATLGRLKPFVAIGETVLGDSAVSSGIRFGLTGIRQGFTHFAKYLGGAALTGEVLGAAYVEDITSENPSDLSKFAHGVFSGTVAADRATDVAFSLYRKGLMSEEGVRKHLLSELKQQGVAKPEERLKEMERDLGTDAFERMALSVTAGAARDVLDQSSAAMVSIAGSTFVLPWMRFQERVAQLEAAQNPEATAKAELDRAVASVNTAFGITPVAADQPSHVATAEPAPIVDKVVTPVYNAQATRIAGGHGLRPTDARYGELLIYMEQAPLLGKGPEAPEPPKEQVNVSGFNEPAVDLSEIKKGVAALENLAAPEAPNSAVNTIKPDRPETNGLG